VGAVVEGPVAVRIAAGLQPAPGAVPLRVADDEQQGGGQRRQALVVGGPQVHRVVVEHDRLQPDALGEGTEKAHIGGPQVRFSAVGDEQGPDALADGADADQVDVGAA